MPMKEEYDFSGGTRGKHAGKRLNVLGDMLASPEVDDVNPSRSEFRIPPNAFQVFLDVWALEGYVKMLENELPRVIEEERKRVWQSESDDDDADSYEAVLAAYELDKGITTRLLTGSAVVAGWATYESVVQRIAKQRSPKKDLKLKEIKGAFPQAARKYFRDVLNEHLHPDETDYKYLDGIYALRNALAHANGQLDDIPTENRKRLKQLTDKLDGVEIINGQLIISIEFIRPMFKSISGLLYELSGRMHYEQHSATDDGEREPKSR
jgi:hypothetical protein